MEGAKNGCVLFKTLIDDEPRLSEAAPCTKFRAMISHYDGLDTWLVTFRLQDALTSEIKNIRFHSYFAYTLEGEQGLF